MRVVELAWGAEAYQRPGTPLPVTCDPSRAVTLPYIGVFHYIGVPHRVTYPYLRFRVKREQLKRSN